jgi:hypothetical protein
MIFLFLAGVFIGSFIMRIVTIKEWADFGLEEKAPKTNKDQVKIISSDEFNDCWPKEADFGLEEKAPKTNKDQVKIISSDEFLANADDHFFFPQETLTYYETDNVLVDMDGKPYPKVYAPLFYDILQHFGEQCDDPDRVYVRSYIYMKDYEIIRVHEPYGITGRRYA